MNAFEVSSPLRPWNLVLAHDEVTPGNILRPDNGRKFSSFYFTFYEFGDIAVRHECMWFHVAVLRSSIEKQVVGGLSCALRLLMRAFVLEADSFAQGVLLPLDSGPTLLFARLRNHLGDEAGLAAGLNIKGAAGIRPCLLCPNVLKKNSNLVSLRPDRLVEINCTDVHRFSTSEDRDVWRQYDRLSALDAHATRGEMERQTRATGLNIQANGLIADVALRPHVGPISSFTYDWQHTYLSNGIASHEMFVFLGACRQEGFDDIYTKLGEFCRADWKFTKQLHSSGNSAHKVFNRTREKASTEHWKSGASELLAV